MKSSLSHLPKEKQKQIIELTEIIKQVSPAMIILHGSYATGEWQQGWSTEKNTVLDFNSDFDFLVIMKDGDEIKEMSLTDKLNNTLRNHTPVDVLVHSIAQVNSYLEKGHYFFIEIIKNGILLYDTEEFALAEPKEMSPVEIKQVSQEYFDYWYELSSYFLGTAIDNFNKVKGTGKRLNYATYNLFQATEGFYTTTLLVFTGYKPKTHNLDKFRNYTKNISPGFNSIFPRKPKDRQDQDLFELLKRSYIGAKYKMDFSITEDELTSLINKIKEMADIVKKICLNRINSL